jgi:DNA-directed RNA polymerase subunit E'/Rpb7
MSKRQQQQTTNGVKYTANPIYETKVLSEIIQLPPKFTNSFDISDVILRFLRQKVEGKCISEGFIKPDSTEIVSRGLGCLENQNFTSAVTYFVKYKAEICNPKEGQVFECVVENNDETNCECFVGDAATSPVEVYLFREHYIGNTEYASLQRGDKILVRVLETQNDFGNEKILVSGVFLGKA